MKDVLSIYEKKCNPYARFCKSVIFWPEIAFSCLQIALNTISGITTSYYIFLLCLFCLSQLFLAFCVQLFAQRDKESAIAESKYSRFSGNPEEVLWGIWEYNTLLPALTRVGGYQRGKEGHSTAVSANAFNMF